MSRGNPAPAIRRLWVSYAAEMSPAQRKAWKDAREAEDDKQRSRAKLDAEKWIAEVKARKKGKT